MERFTKDFLQNIYPGDKNRFNALYNFYKAFYVSTSYQVKIMVTRRSYVLYKIFEKVFLHDSSVKKYGNFFTSHYINKLDIEELSKVNKTSESEIKILILDDIVINGRTIKSIYHDLLTILNSESSSNIKVKSRLAHST